MASLKIEITRNLTEVVELGTEKSKSISIGRGKDNEIILLDNIVSRHHAKVYYDGDDVFIEDLNSSNGIFVNDTKVILQALQDGDIIKVGKTKIFFSTEVWELPPKIVDFTKASFSDYDEEDIIASKDILFRFYSDDESINLTYDISRKKFELVPVDEMVRINLDAALNEAVGNAQRHGHHYNPEMIIEYRYIHRPDRLIMRVTDQGAGFDYKSVLKQKKSGNAVEEARERYQQGGYGGLGIMLMLKCVDKVEYNSKGNQVTLTKFLGEAARKFKQEQEEVDREKNSSQASPSNPFTQTVEAKLNQDLLDPPPPLNLPPQDTPPETPPGEDFMA